MRSDKTGATSDKSEATSRSDKAERQSRSDKPTHQSDKTGATKPEKEGAKLARN